MLFQNIMMLGGIAAFTLPLLIHLLNRSRYRVVSWGAMHLLRDVTRVNRRRVRVERWLLLLIRCAIPILLALCMARPLLTRFSSLTGDAPTSLVLLVDDSYSMEAQQDGITSLVAAKREAERILDSLPRGSETSLIRMGGKPAHIGERATASPETLLPSLQGLPGGYGAARIEGSLEVAARTLARMKHARREVVLLSDYQRRDWSEIDEAARIRIEKLLLRDDASPVLTFLPIQHELDSNLSVEKLSFPDTAVGIGQEVEFRVQVRNRGQQRASNVRIAFHVDESEHSIETRTIEPGQSEEIAFRCKFLTGGSHSVQVSLDDDGLQTDNTVVAAIPVLDTIHALVVDGDPDERPLRSEASFFAAALQPYAAASLDRSDLIHVKNVSLKDFQRTDLADVRVVILANVAELSFDQFQPLESFVRSGGGLLVFSGNRVNMSWYNSTFVGGGQGSGLLPARMEGIAGDLEDRTKQASIEAQHFQHAALSLFNDPREGDLTDGRVYLWHRLALNQQVAPTGINSAVIMAKLTTGDPFLVAQPLEHGMVIQCATAADTDWSNLPTRASYLPLAQQLVLYLAARVSPPRNLNCGQELVAMLGVNEAFEKLELTDAAAKKHVIEPTVYGRYTVAHFGETERPGLYRIETTNEGTVHFGVNAARTESEAELIEGKELAELAETWGARIVVGSEEYSTLEAEQRYGREIWREVLFLVGLLFLAEMYLQGRYTQGTP